MFFDQQPCADLLGELVGERGMASSKAWKGASLEMKGLEFTTNYGTNSTIHKISGLSEKSARESFFTKVSFSFETDFQILRTGKTFLLPITSFRLGKNSIILICLV
jgi:hypothetical protein